MKRACLWGGSLTAVTAIAVAATGAALASDSYCYFVDENGIAYDLGDLCGGVSVPIIPLSSPPSLPAAPQFDADYEAFLESQGLTQRWEGHYVGRDRIDLAYEVWTVDGGGGFYYFLKGNNFRVDGQPDIIAYFDENVAFVTDEHAYACYYQTGECEAERYWPRWRYTCLVPWQYVGDRRCGSSAPIRDFSNP